MPHVSSQQVNTQVLKKLYELFFASITSRRHTLKLQREFFNELLTPTEKVMLAKRLTAIALLARGAAPYHVGRALKLSPTTTGKLLEKLDRRDFKHIVQFDKEQRKGDLVHYLENLMLSPLPPYGKSWWRVLEE
jgi:uncharacterized protein YerC